MFKKKNRCYACGKALLSKEEQAIIEKKIKRKKYTPPELIDKGKLCYYCYRYL